ncbi:MAG: NnrU family protein [Pseudomonadota bacterium]
MSAFALAFAFFVVSHSLPTRPTVRRRLVQVLGERGFQVAYSLLSLAALGWLLAAAIEAPWVGLWGPAPWQYWLAVVLMPIAFALGAVAVAVPNPLSISLRRTPPDWNRSGVLRIVRHPLLLALALWAGLHVPANGDVVSLMLFGGLAVFALAGQRLVDRRRVRDLGAAAHAALLEKRGAYDDGRTQVIAAGCGLLAYALALVLHPLVFGVDPLAWW